MGKIPVGILGATGLVGQKFVLALADHPWFEIHALAASERSVGRRYSEVTSWKQSVPIPESVAFREVQPCQPHLDCRIVFSGLDSSVAGEIEADFAKGGYWVFSNAKNYRMAADVPLVIAELNPGHLELISVQRKNRDWSGAIVTNANCSAIVLTLSLGPLHRAFGIKTVQVVTFQAISGAGYPGVASLDVLGNVIPFIPGEEDKIEEEPQKILGSFNGKSISAADFSVSAHANRVPVEEGHLECVSVTLEQKPSLDELRRCWEDFRGRPQEVELPSAPARPVLVLDEPSRPQPRLDVWKFGGMSCLVGRVRPCPLADFKYVVLGHNTIRGAAGASVLNAELAAQMGMLD